MPDDHFIIPNPEVRRVLGWDARHDATAREIIRQYDLKLPRDRELIRQLAIVRVQQGTGERVKRQHFIPSWDDPDA